MLNTQEIEVTIQLIDVAVKATGLQNASNALVITKKLQEAHAKLKEDEEPEVEEVKEEETK